jgi:hypothetical protein
MAGLGLLRLVKPPERWASVGGVKERKWQAFGAEFEITNTGKAFVEQLKARGQ